MHAFVTGCGGFIGSNLVDRLLAEGHRVTGFDNFSTGRREFVAQALSSERMRLVEADLLDDARLADAMSGCDFVFHLAANADVRHGLEHPRLDLEQNTLATHNVLEAMRRTGATRLAFSSTGSVYGEPEVFPTPEDAPFPVQTSLYAASKLAAEATISAYCAGFGFQALIFRFVSILGERYTHGHVFDFYRKLLADPHDIEVLGNGRQRKSYLYVGDCVSAILAAARALPEQVGIYNLGSDSWCTVDDSLDWICAELGLNPRRHYTGGERGWVGDSPFIFLDCDRIRGLGWQPTLSIRQAVVRTLDFLRDNQWLLEARQ